MNTENLCPGGRELCPGRRRIIGGYTSCFRHRSAELHHEDGSRCECDAAVADPATCPDCVGSGERGPSIEGAVPCYRCDGTGIVAAPAKPHTLPEREMVVKALERIVNEGPPMFYYDGGSVGEYACCHRPDYGERHHGEDCWWIQAKAALRALTEE